MVWWQLAREYEELDMAVPVTTEERSNKRLLDATLPLTRTGKAR